VTIDHIDPSPCARYSIMTRKESPLAYNEYMHACASSLAATKEVPSDADLVFHLELTREADRVSTLFNYSETLQPQRMSDEQMQIHLNTFSSKIRDSQAHIPTTMTEEGKVFFLSPSLPHSLSHTHTHSLCPGFAFLSTVSSAPRLTWMYSLASLTSDCRA
jgi:hypothetical protein